MIVTREQSTGPFRTRGPVEIDLADDAELRHDPFVHRAYQRVALGVFRVALEDLASDDRESAWEFLWADPNGDRDQDQLFAHWWAYLRTDTTLDHVRRTASRARCLAQAEIPYTAATIWRKGTDDD